MITIVVYGWGFVWLAISVIGGIILGGFLEGLIKGYKEQKKDNKIMVSTETFKQIEEIVKKNKLSISK